MGFYRHIRGRLYLGGVRYRVFKRCTMGVLIIRQSTPRKSPRFVAHLGYRGETAFCKLLITTASTPLPSPSPFVPKCMFRSPRAPCHAITHLHHRGINDDELLVALTAVIHLHPGLITAFALALGDKTRLEILQDISFGNLRVGDEACSCCHTVERAMIM